MSEIKVNKISPRTACGTTTLGDSGDTFTIPAGVSINNNGTASGFGATGSASWNTTVKTTDFTAVVGEGYFVNTTSGEVDVTLPAGTAGAVIAVADYANNFSTANCILKQNGSDKIEGSTDNYKVNVDGAAITLVFVDSTKGWITTDTGNSDDANSAEFICATGGTITNTPTCRIHTFTGPGTFTVNKVSATTPSRNDVSYLVVAGGGSGGARNPGNQNGGGGGGGFREDKSPLTPYTASPLDGAPAITLAAGSYPIVVGAGGAAISQTSSNLQGNDGSNSSFDSVTSAGGGGGGGGGNDVPLTNGRPGGSGGGAGGGIPSGVTGGTGNSPPTNPAQGFNGGVGGNGSPNSAAGGGGGATEVGQQQQSPHPSGQSISGRGGAGATTNISNSPVGYSGGGGGSGSTPINMGAASPCGSGGKGGISPTGPAGDMDGETNRGGGGGGGFAGGCSAGVSGGGGSGVVIIRYKIA